MRTLYSLCLLVLLTTGVNAQNDRMFKKDGAVIPCKVREITLDVIKYERVDVRRGPIIQIAKTEVWKIVYSSGTKDVIDPEYVKAQKYDTIKRKVDTNDYVLLYVVYNSGQSSQVFPLEIKGQ